MRIANLFERFAQAFAPAVEKGTFYFLASQPPRTLSVP
jgi:hypothetical protein